MAVSGGASRRARRMVGWSATLDTTHGSHSAVVTAGFKLKATHAAQSRDFEGRYRIGARRQSRRQCLSA